MCAILVIPVHCADSVELLNAEHWAQIMANFIQRLLWLLMNDQEPNSLPYVLKLIPS